MRVSVPFKSVATNRFRIRLSATRQSGKGRFHRCKYPKELPDEANPSTFQKGNLPRGESPVQMLHPRSLPAPAQEFPHSEHRPNRNGSYIFSPQTRKNFPKKANRFFRFSHRKSWFPRSRRIKGREIVSSPLRTPIVHG